MSEQQREQQPLAIDLAGLVRRREQADAALKKADRPR